MSTDWLVIQSFQHDQDILSAINILSIHTKLELAGVLDEKRAEAANQAREKLASFFQQLEAMLQEAGETGAEPVLGTNLRLRQLVTNFTAAKRDRTRFRSALFRNTLPYAQQLLYSNERSDKQSVLRCLEELRMLIEQHIHDDAVRILGET